MASSPSSPASSSSRVALITGGNKGIGFEIVQQLAKADPALTVLLASRDQARGTEAVQRLGLPNVRPLSLEVTSDSSIAAAVEAVRRDYGGLDLLCNNAGVYLWGRDDDASGNEQSLDETLAINYHAVLRITQQFFPIMRPNGRIVNVSSGLGTDALSKMAPPLRTKFINQQSLDGLTSLISEFRKSYLARSCAADGWSPSAYGVSKAGVIVASRILNEHAPEGVTVVSGCPGWCRTDMGSDKAPLTAADGGAALVFVLTTPQSELTPGAFYQERRVVPVAA